MCVPCRCWVLLSPVPLHCLLFTSTASVSHCLSQGLKDSQLFPSAVLAHMHVGEEALSPGRGDTAVGMAGTASLFGEKS